MPRGVALPSFFVESLRDSFRSSSRSASFSAAPEELQQQQDSGAESLTPFVHQEPALFPKGHHHEPNGSSADLLREPVQPIALAAQSIIKSGCLKKRSKQLSSLWQPRFVVLEGPPTNVFIYYAASAASAAEDASMKPRGVVPLNVSLTLASASRAMHRAHACAHLRTPTNARDRYAIWQEASAEMLAKDQTSFRVKAPLRVYDFRASTSAEALDWIQQINAAATATALSLCARSGASSKSAAEAAAPAAVGAAATAVAVDSRGHGHGHGRWSKMASVSGNGRNSENCSRPGSRPHAPAPPTLVQVRGSEAWVDISAGGGTTYVGLLPPAAASPVTRSRGAASGGGIEEVGAQEYERGTGATVSTDL